MRTVLAFDVETRMLASEVEREHAEVLAGASPWARPDLFGFGVGCLVDSWASCLSACATPALLSFR